MCNETMLYRIEMPVIHLCAIILLTSGISEMYRHFWHDGLQFLGSGVDRGWRMGTAAMQPKVAECDSLFRLLLPCI
jgi:hypothetical protein